MALKDEISKAIAAHGMWKTRLKTAIATGKLDTPLEKIRADNQCAFGQWLYGTSIAPKDKSSAHYQNVKALHAEFHKVAARVADLAQKGDRAGAEALMSLGGEYTAVS
ncbi:MAG: CZB domain-containing protein, partial [Burkholderiales bacterium]|nr:CZB domain-containing protein [Burkholderiales bacterium]